MSSSDLVGSAVSHAVTEIIPTAVTALPVQVAHGRQQAFAARRMT